MWMAILSFLGGPVIKGLIDAYQAKLKAGKVDAKIAADLAASEIAARTLETQSLTQLKIAEIGHPWEPEKNRFLHRTGILREMCGVGHHPGPRLDARPQGGRQHLGRSRDVILFR
jgi:hypothetical protein